MKIPPGNSTPAKFPSIRHPLENTPRKILTQKIPTRNIPTLFIISKLLQETLFSLNTSYINKGESVHVHPPPWTKFFHVFRTTWRNISFPLGLKYEISAHAQIENSQYHL